MNAPLPTELVAELRQMAATGYAGCQIWAKAADEIERLERELAEVRAELATHEPWRAGDVGTAQEAARNEPTR
jgi:sugar phosphate isomerase/epimerase